MVALPKGVRVGLMKKQEIWECIGWKALTSLIMTWVWKYKESRQIKHKPGLRALNRYGSITTEEMQ